MFVPTEHFDIVVNDFGGKTSARANRIRYEQDQVHFIDDEQLQKMEEDPRYLHLQDYYLYFHYRPPTKLREGNVFSLVYPSASHCV